MPHPEIPGSIVQLDVQLCSPGYFYWRVFQASYTNLAQIIGVVIRSLGLAATDKGLHVRIAEIESTNKEHDLSHTPLRKFQKDVTRKLVKIAALNERVVVEEADRAKGLIADVGEWEEVEAEVERLVDEKAAAAKKRKGEEGEEVEAGSFSGWCCLWSLRYRARR
ncbi:hypothetical protein IWX90DRAFT_411529 [Phyllosticta citrichinensis]|uniref:Uncharacterized protein n=1 Tax=Phyllosticta citrichinensis TaxID=1130410 RepID=A0ABR1Y8C0_9PEZI